MTASSRANSSISLRNGTEPMVCIDASYRLLMVDQPAGRTDCEDQVRMTGSRSRIASFANAATCVESLRGAY